MNSPKYSRRFRTKHQSLTRTPTEKLVVFQVGNEHFAIPIERVQRVLKEFTPHGTLGSGRSLVRHQNETITLIDVSALFLAGSASSDSNYLIVCALNRGERFGIPIAEMPAILDVPLDQLSEIPELYRQGKLAPAVEKLIHSADGKAIFYLNLDKLVNLL